MSTETIKSPLAPDFNENPLRFDTEWLRPPLNDIHARSRLQVLMLGYLNASKKYLLDTEREVVQLIFVISRSIIFSYYQMIVMVPSWIPSRG